MAPNSNTSKLRIVSMRLNLPALSLLLCLGTAPALAQTAPAAPTAAPETAPALTAPALTAPALTAPALTAPGLTATDVSALLDGLVPGALARDDIAGAVVTVVANGQVLLTKGYGLADVAAGTQVSPDSTMFRIGSISKTFIWVAVMQLVEQKKLDLDRDINDYLDFHVEGLNGAKITLRHLMTHSAGFEDTIRDLIVTGTLPPEKTIEWYVKTHLPPVRTAPGAEPAYSNYGATLAAYIVQRVSGQPYASVLQDHILTPLGMTHTSLAQPLPAGLTASQGYDKASDPAKPFEIIPASPVGAISTTGADMGRYMLALLHPGTLIKPQTEALMLRHAAGIDPRVDGMALGFMETNTNGLRSVGHGGDTQFFHSDLQLLMDQGVGVFVSVNSAGKKGENLPLRQELWRAFMNRYYPRAIPPLQPIATARQDAQALAGDWVLSRRRDSGITHVLSLLGSTSVSAGADGKITIAAITGDSGAPSQWTEVAHDLWQDPTGLHFAVTRGPDGAPALIAPEPVSGIMVLERAPPSERGWISLGLGGALAVLVAALALMPIRALARRVYRGVSASQGGWPVVGKLFVLITPLGFVGAVAFMASGLNGHLEWLSTEHSRPWLMGLRYGGLVVLASSVVAVSQAARWWAPQPQGGVRWRRFEATLVALASLALSLAVLGYGFMDPGYDF